MMLQPDGTFKVNYGYDPVPIEDQLDRVDAWLAHNLE
jgi:hypothetical protein